MIHAEAPASHRWRPCRDAASRALLTLAGMAMLLLAAGAHAAPALPSTVPALRVQALIDTFNRGDAQALERFVAATFMPAEQDPAFAAHQAGQLHRLHQLTGPLELRQVEASDTASLRVLAQARRTSAWYRLSVFTTAAPPDFTAAVPPCKIVGLGIVAIKLREWLSPAQPAALAEVAAPPELALSVRPAQAAVGAGQEAAIELQVANRGGAARSVVVDLEIKDEAGRKVEQQFVADQRMGASETRAYRFVWRPAAPGRYQLGAGVFGPGWSPRLKFEDGLATIEAR